ncbi:MAG: substrate-binding domain-containing protein [Christensenellaceae bacterium]|nr:substrate-binding domain-containing protein [Christensenellaceae bacterium]
MKKLVAFFLTLTLLVSLSMAGYAAKPSVGVLWYSFSDTFIATARQCLLNIAKADGTFDLQDADSMGDVPTQTNNLNNMLTQGRDYIVINNINDNDVDNVIQSIVDNGCKVVMANCSAASDETYAANEGKVFLVTSQATQSGTIMGEKLAEYWLANPDADRNGNGKLDYIMLLGFQTHYDTIVRNEYSIAALKEAGIEVNNIGGDIVCDYQRAQAQDKVAALLANYSDDIDAIIACNDDMALGAIEALKAGGFFGDGTYIPVCGVDATAAGQEAVADGTMLVTALNNPIKLSQGIYKVLKLMEAGEEVTTESVDIEGVHVDGAKVWISYIGITKDNLEEAAYDVNTTDF